MSKKRGLRWDWAGFCTRYGVQFVERGPNVARGHIGIKCPFCGTADRSEHMGLNLDDSKWGCFRNKNHRGIRPERLIVALIRCTWAEAKAMVDDGAEAPLNSIAELRSRLETKTVQERRQEVVRFPRDFREIRRGDRFHRYLQDRDFWRIKDLAKTYTLRGALTGRFAYRLICPVYDGGLIGWTGRAIAKATKRYDAHPSGEGLSSKVFNADACEEGGEALVIVEGPLDALKVDHAGREFGVRSCAAMGVGFSEARLARLAGLGARFRQTVILLDSEALARALELESALRASGLYLRRERLPSGFGDPGELLRDPARGFCQSLAAA